MNSGPGCGTRITVLLPLVPEAALQLGKQEVARYAKEKIEGEHRQDEEESIL